MGDRVNNRTVGKKGRSVWLSRAIPVAAALLCTVVPAFAQGFPALRLEPGVSSYPLGPHLQIYEDVSRTLSLEQVQAPEVREKFIPNPDAGAEIHFGYSRSAYWMKFSLANDGQGGDAWLLHLANPLVDEADLYWKGLKGPVRVVRTGDRKPFSERPLVHRDFVFPLDLPPGETREFFLRIQTDGPVSLPLTILSREAFQISEQHALLLMGGYYGLALSMAVLSLWLFFSIRDRVCLFFMLWILPTVAVQATMSGIAYQYFWPGSPWWERKAMPFAMGLAVVGMTLFALEFMKRSTPHRFLCRALKGCGAAGFLFMLGVFLTPNPLALKLMSALSQVSIVVVLLTAAMGWLSGFRPSRLFTVGWVVLLLGTFVGIGRSWGWLPVDFWTLYGNQVGSAAAIVLLSFSLTERVRAIDRERITLRDGRQVYRRLAITDGLTGLYNRGFLDESLPRETARAKESGHDLSLLFLEVDNFKSFNDAYSQSMGDVVLQRLSEVIRENIREADSPFRYGDEEFIVLLPGTNLAGGFHVAERIRLYFQSIVFRSEGDKSVISSVSVGLTSYKPGETPSDLLTRVDKALHQAKQEGRNRTAVVDP
ncbi:MAG: sensor domain-containing diguanylate cyclase [Deltaproteobacteria bacterium]|nr:sensor domain-containing diguanylate cyclase [Deltaproteobacteria bacterium]